jgi:signal transduction histidine kinase
MSKYQTRLHDIRKPLNTMSMQAELIRMITEQMDVDSATKDKLEAAAIKIIDNAKDCSGQLQDMFDEMNNDSSE